MITQANMLFKKDKKDCNNNLNYTVKIWAKLQILKGKYIPEVKN